MQSISYEDIQKLTELQFGRLGVKASDRLAEDLGAESADVMNLVAMVEQKFDIVLKASEIAQIFTPQDLFELVQAKLNAA